MNFTCSLLRYVATRKFEILYVPPIVYLLNSAGLYSYIVNIL